MNRSAVLAIGIAGVAALAAGVVYWQGQAAAPGDASDPEQVAFGGRVYGRICSSCHGANLDGQLGWEEPMNDGTRLAPAHNEEGGTWHHSDEILFEVVKFGGDVLKTDGATSRMPAFEDKLTDDEIWAVIAFIKSSWPNDVQEIQQSVASE